MGNSCNKYPPFWVSTLGDSLTDQGKIFFILEYNIDIKNN